MREFAAALIAVAVTALSLAVPPAASAPLGALPEYDPTPLAPNAVRAAYTTRVLEDLSGFKVVVDLTIYELELPPTGGHSAAELRAAAVPLRELFETTVRETVLQEAQRVLPEAKVRLEGIEFDYAATDADQDPYRPGLGVHAALEALFTPQFFGLPATLRTPPAEIARAFLYSGGTYDIQKHVRVPPGFDARYFVSAPEFLQLDCPTSGITNLVEFRGNNFEGSSPSAVSLNFGIRLRPDAVPSNVREGPLVRAVFIVDDATPLWKQLVPFTNGEYVGNLDLMIEVNSLDASLFASYPLPSALRLDHISGDLLRIAIREDLVARHDVTTFFQELIERSLKEGFGDDVQVQMDWSELDSSLNQAVGGADGETVHPVLVHATAILPFESNKMFVSSTLGRLVGMTFGMRGSFHLVNDGMWNSDYTVAYPENVHVEVKDSEGLTQTMDWGSREGFHLYLSQGESTHVQVDGRSDFDALIFLAGLLEVLLVLLASYGIVRRIQGARSARAHPWAI